MHSFGWTRDKALKYMLSNTAMSEQDAGVEVTRYITWPGQACAYKVGERKLDALRKKFEEKLASVPGDIRDFYDIVLTGGAVPLTILENKIDEFIENTLKGNTETKDAEVSALGDGSASLVGLMTFANKDFWCKCCPVPGSCQLPT